MLNDVWNTAPYLHDGSAATLLDVVRPCQQRFGACEVFATKGRNVDDLHGTTSFMSARQLNDLVAFQKAPRGPLTEAVAIHGTALTVKRLRLQFGKKAGKDKAALVASASLGSDQVLDPTSEGVDLTIGVPAGDTMTYVEWNVPGSALKAKKTTWKATKRAGVNGLKKLVLSVKGTNLAVSLAATTDLGVLRGTKADLTIAVEVGDDVAGVTRPAKANKRGTLVKVP